MDQAKGNFKTNINRDKRPGDRKPVYNGRFVKPGTDEEYAFALFLGRGKDGKRFLSGPISRQPVNGSFDAQMDALLAGPADLVEPVEGQPSEYRLFLLDNEFKDVAVKDGVGERPNLWGRAQLGAGEAEIHLAVWEKESRYQVNPHITKYLTGSTQYPLEKAAPVAAPAAKPRKKSGERDGR
ncbi:MAG: hypothetical protein ACKVP7_04265 [Hyphomicrobiaceae bacterium]